jgi:hypothetical protein
MKSGQETFALPWKIVQKIHLQQDKLIEFTEIVFNRMKLPDAKRTWDVKVKK